MVYAKNPGNEKEAESILKFLKDKASDKTRGFTEWKPESKKFRIWGSVTLNDAALADARKHPAIQRVRVEPRGKQSLVLPAKNVTDLPDETHGSMIMPRAAGDWIQQKNAPQPLIVLSMPK